jgi:hypothetical protein
MLLKKLTKRAEFKHKPALPVNNASKESQLMLGDFEVHFSSYSANLTAIVDT